MPSPRPSWCDTGDVSPGELVDAAIARIERWNGELNTVVTPTFELARNLAASVSDEGPFAGVPFLLKDFGTEWGGVRFTEGSRFADDYVSPYDQELVVRYRELGGLSWSFVALTSTGVVERHFAAAVDLRRVAHGRMPLEPLHPERIRSRRDRYSLASISPRAKRSSRMRAALSVSAVPAGVSLM